jgi:acetoin utilization deacetylase AcuC-like enzyme
MRVADAHAQGRVAAILEGGYDLQALRTAIPAVLDELGAADTPLATPMPRPGVLEPARAAQRPYWDIPAAR